MSLPFLGLRPALGQEAMEGLREYKVTNDWEQRA